MEEKDCKRDKLKIKKNGEDTDENAVINTQIECHALVCQDNITLIDLSARKIGILDEKLKLPTNLVQLNLSYNKFMEVPAPVLNLEKLKILNLSHNRIELFDDKPNFCHTLEQLDMSHNQLVGPPYWIWTETPQNLTELSLDHNNITQFFIKYGGYEELLQYSTLVTKISLQNCKLGKFIGILATFPKAKTVCLGSKDYLMRSNSLVEVPCKGLDKCCDIKTLDLRNTSIYTINPNIVIYENLIEINLAQNYINGLPNEFCNLVNLEICVLSCNKILYLPDEICRLQKLTHLYLDSNEMCMLPDTLCQLSNLKTLDLYNNCLNEIPDTFSNLKDLDLAQNYFEEPEDSEYLEKKANLRIHENRYDGRKDITFRYNEQDDENYSASDKDDEELFEIFDNKRQNEDAPSIPDPPSSPEDWDSDDYWVPFFYKIIPPATTPWLSFIKQKMKEGSFCPMDIHPISIAEKVQYEKQCNPQVYYESDGQFDDYSSDNT